MFPLEQLAIELKMRKKQYVKTIGAHNFYLYC